MAQKLTSQDEAAEQLGISKERLNALREAGKVRGYRDGASWKFRSEDIDRLASEGIPEIDPGASDLSLDIGDEFGSGILPPAAQAEPSGLDLDLSDDEPELAKAADSDLGLAPAGSDLSLDDVDEPTVAGLDDDDDALALDDLDEINLNTDSILMSEAELGAKSSRPPSTIIGKAELDLDADLDLSPIDKGATSPRSDVRLAEDSGLTPLAADDDELSLDLESGTGNFDDLDELDIDLEAESSRILSPDDVAKAQAAAKAAAESKGTGLSDLGLAPGSSAMNLSSDIGIGGSSGSGNVGLSGLSALELDDDDDGVLGEGSDVTLSGESSGINIISPSDSGLALDEVPLDLSGSAPIGSSLDLGGDSSPSGLSLEASGIGSGLGLGSKVGEDFQLTPLGDADEDEEKDSSQVIALDEISEESGAPLASGFGEAEMLGDDFGTPALAPSAMPVGAAAGDIQFSGAHVFWLGSCILMIGLCGMVTYDLVTNIWGWQGVSGVNKSTLLEALNPFLK